jgi:hypothetical protein
LWGPFGLPLSVGSEDKRIGRYKVADTGGVNCPEMKNNLLFAVQYSTKKQAMGCGLIPAIMPLRVIQVSWTTFEGLA